MSRGPVDVRQACGGTTKLPGCRCRSRVALWLRCRVGELKLNGQLVARKLNRKLAAGEINCQLVSRAAKKGASRPKTECHYCRCSWIWELRCRAQERRPKGAVSARLGVHMRRTHRVLFEFQPCKIKNRLAKNLVWESIFGQHFSIFGQIFRFSRIEF